MSYVFRGTLAAPQHATTCGTYAGYQAHRTKGESPCEGCARAHSTYMREYRRRKGLTKSTLVPLNAECPNCGHHVTEKVSA